MPVGHSLDAGKSGKPPTREKARASEPVRSRGSAKRYAQSAARSARKFRAFAMPVLAAAAESRACRSGESTGGPSLKACNKDAHHGDTEYTERTRMEDRGWHPGRTRNRGGSAVADRETAKRRRVVRGGPIVLRVTSTRGFPFSPVLGREGRGEGAERSTEFRTTKPRRHEERQRDEPSILFVSVFVARVFVVQSRQGPSPQPSPLIHAAGDA